MLSNTELSNKMSAPIIFACSGAADVGEISDIAARRLAREGVGAMSCLAGVSANVEAIMNSVRSASTIVVIDGCPQNCAAKALLREGLSRFEHVQLFELGMKKKESPGTAERIDTVVRACKAALRVS